MSIAYSGMMSSARRRRRQERERAATAVHNRRVQERMADLVAQHPDWTTSRCRVEAQHQVRAASYPTHASS